MNILTYSQYEGKNLSMNSFEDYFFRLSGLFSAHVSGKLLDT